MFDYNNIFKSIFSSHLNTSTDEQNTDLNICSSVKEIGDNIYKDDKNTIYINESGLKQNSIKIVESRIDNSSKDYIMTITGTKSYPFSGKIVYKIKCNKIQYDSYAYIDGVVIIKTKSRS